MYGRPELILVSSADYTGGWVTGRISGDNPTLRRTRDLKRRPVVLEMVVAGAEA